MRVATLTAVLLLVAGCGTSGTNTADMDLSPFVADMPGHAKVVENSTACIVDGMCFLRLQFADTTIEAIYGVGEQATSPCDIPHDASTAAFRAAVGDIVRVAVAPCAPHGVMLQHLFLQLPGAP